MERHLASSSQPEAHLPTGEMLARVRSFDWSATALGPRELWPESLCTLVDVCLASGFPMFVWWGPDLINIYNDAYAPVLGGRHPEALGRPAREVWADIWPDIGDDVLRVVRDGASIVKERVRFVMTRHGFPEETFFTYSHCPIPDGKGGFAGLFQICADETLQVRAELREAFFHALDEAVRPLSDPAEITATHARLLGQYLKVDRCAYADVEADQDTFNLTGDYNNGVPSIVGRYRFADFGPEVLALMRADQPFVVHDVDHHDPPISDPTAYRAMMIQSVICVPLHKEGRFAAAMAVHQKTPRHWLPHEVELMRLVAARCWESIERARVEREREQIAAEQERSVRALETERANLAALVERAPAFMGTLRGPAFVFELANERLFEVVGRRDIVGKTVREALPEVEGQGFFELIEEVYRTGQTFTGRELPVLLRRGGKELERRFVNLLYQALHEPNGAVSGIFIHGVDVTDLVLSREALRESEERLRLGLEAGNTGTWDWDMLSDRIVWSNRIYEFHGLTPETFGGRLEDFQKLIHPEDAARVGSAIQKAIEERSDFRVEFRAVRPGGEVRWLATSGKVFYDKSGKPVRMMGASIDITEAKEAEARERKLIEDTMEATAKFRAVFDQSPVFAGIVTLDGTVIEANHLCLDVCGYRAEEVLNKPFWDTPWWRQSTEVQALVRKGVLAAAAGQPFRNILPYHWADGSKHVVDFAIHPIRDETGRVIFVHPTGVDITDRKRGEEELARAKAELEQANQHLEEVVAERTAKLRETIGELEAFSYSISHDMRSPLRAMQGFSQVLVDTYLDQLDEDGIDMLRRIERGARRLDLLIQDVLAYSRVAKGVFEMSRVDLDTLVPEIILSFNYQNADIRVEHPLPAVLGHEPLLTQIISNLVGNAVKFTRPGVKPVVRIYAEKIESVVRVSVEDNGVGIDPAHFKQIFVIFGRVYSETEYAGTGIGLAIVKKAVERLNGQIGVESELGQGSRFWFTLPAA